MSRPLTLGPDGFERRTLGFGRVGERTLTEDERVSLAQDARRWRLAAWMLVVAVALAPVLGILPFALLPRGQVATVLGNITLVLLVLVGMPLLIVLARDRHRWARGVCRDLKDPRVEIFEGEVGPDKVEVQFVADMVLLNSGLVALERHPISGRLYSVCGERSERWAVVEASDTAPCPVIGNAEARSNEPALPRRRGLSDTESIELSRHVRHLRRLPSLAVLFFLPVGLLGFAVQTLSPERPGRRVETAILFLLYFTMCWFMLRNLIQRRRLASQLAGFAAEGHIEIRGDSREVLSPHGIEWTLDGEPARWRVEPK